MGRRNTFTSFVRYNMPFDRPGSLTDQQAYDVAAFVLSHPRPDLAGKENDWPNGDPPPDVAYPTTAAKRKTAAAERSTPTSAH
jgi:thiosulfate dehydrogenase